MPSFHEHTSSDYAFIVHMLTLDNIPHRAYPTVENGTYLYYVDTARGRSRYSAGGHFMSFSEGSHDHEVS
jgi:hypothetical protein